MAKKTLTITLPESPEDREEVIAFLISKGLIERKQVEPPRSENGHWAKVAKEMASHA